MFLKAVSVKHLQLCEGWSCAGPHEPGLQVWLGPMACPAPGDAIGAAAGVTPRSHEVTGKQSWLLDREAAPAGRS